MKTPSHIHKDIVQEGYTYHIEHEGAKTELIPVSTEETLYVRTEPNDSKQDNLLNIDRC